ncbi:gliding motility-associated C-terminal domain-containing protein [Runella slithyformis]|uniref:Gliding motility-associated C-terminal domain-containing protein n=1 Tax=Runella slithyformis (strain ATCC 29530 / DSM 19594 / LMG 11500 / NCIMB 11436 / LSU 4) TaxID=761193 RepID=A0A7U3ZK80_RUNSL|nr:gliding motility-associated C-terminal domain-containing protein [Runella slithyformis]AEI48754.1 hypothetical protein Runsl_2344 [Runella slithyformis DSM 19594]
MACFNYWPKFLNGLLLLCFSCAPGFSQNLVPNSSFEEYFQIPCGRITNQLGIQRYVKEWYTPTFGTSDIWTESTERPCTTSLDNYSLTPYEGTMCAGIFLSDFSKFTPPNDVISKNYREYLQIKLKQPLQKGKIYHVEFYVLFYFTSSLACNNMGVLFSMDSLTNFTPPGAGLLQIPQVVENRVLSNPKKWEKISDCFQAKEAYEYLTIGNFMSHEQTTFEKATYNTDIGPYYLVDKITVEEVDVPGLPIPKFLGADTTLCEGQQLSFELDSLKPYTFLWNDGTNQSNYVIKQAGRYTLELAYKGCRVRDSIQVSLKRKVNLGSDTILCNNTSPPLLSSMGENLLWQDGSTGTFFKANSSGVYNAKSLSANCPSSDTIIVNYLDCPGKVPNVFTPNGDGLNDLFVIDNITLIPWKLEVYNRWGNRVYMNNNYDNSWDGRDLVYGIYYYQLSSEVVQHKLKGWVQILR